MGQYTRVQEPSSGAWYHLYLPADYKKGNQPAAGQESQKWPLVMTFHGMKPYDNARPQIKEWEEQADIYGYIVCAPELQTCDSFMEFPLTREHEYVLEDRRNVIAIMDHVFATTTADPARVLSTSWSSGGYLAHYFANRFPGRFSCVATRLSNFSAKLMAEETVPLYRERIPVAVFIGDGDFSACKRESQEAAAWYQARAFSVVRARTVDNMGHRRIPQTAAAFFAEQLGIDPRRPTDAARTLAALTMTEYFPPSDLINQLSPPRSAPLVQLISNRNEN
jgi:poly(3-hydroxybutyrate) depolymerase